jgi:Zn-dependent protease
VVNFSELIQTILIYALPVVFAITLHEAAHGYVAHKLGDNTAWMLGRVTLNPLSHIDPLGTIAMPALLYFASGGNFLFGYARPVPVRFGNLNHPKRDMIWVALAGPATNFLQALAWLLAFYMMKGFGITETYFLKMSLAGVMVNVSMFVFNLFPLPPLDGGRVLVGVLPWRAAVWLSKIEPYGMYIILGLVAFKQLDDIWMAPLMNWTVFVLSVILSPFEFLLNP